MYANKRARATRQALAASRTHSHPLSSISPAFAPGHARLERRIDSSSRSVAQRTRLNRLFGSRVLQRQRKIEEIRKDLVAATEACEKDRSIANYKKLRALYGELSAAGEPSNSHALFFAEQQLKMGKADAESVERLQQEDIEALRGMAKDEKTPDITRKAITEATGSLDRIKLLESKPGTSEPAKPGEKYGVSYEQKEPDDLRLGRLMHELTHVSVHTAFGDFASHDRPTDKAALSKLEEQVRKERVEKAGQLSKLNKGFTRRQSEIIKTQLDQYAMLKPQRDYDTVLNQLLIYMASWGIVQDNPFYQELVKLATEAYAARQARRNPSAGSK